MKRRRIIVLLAVVLLALGLWWLLRVPELESELEGAKQSAPEAAVSSPVATSSPKSNEERRKGAVDTVLSMLGAPISFYGKVVDQNGDPVPDANVGYSALEAAIGVSHGLLTFL